MKRRIRTFTTPTIFNLSELHGERLAYWTHQYENEKKVLLDQYASEMDSYKNRKFRAHKELECVFYALQAENEDQNEGDEKKQQEKIDDIKSKVLPLQFWHSI